MSSINIREIINRVSSGDIRIPAFQRGYVWKPDQVAFLLDSLYKGFPIGTIFLWKTDERLKSERALGQYNLPEPKKDYPVNYVLDGQQRLTSLFSIFQTDLVPDENIKIEWLDIFYDFQADSNLQESYFVALQSEAINENPENLIRYFPVNTMFNSTQYRKATSKLSEEQIEILDKVQEKFKEVQIPCQTLETDDRSKVAIVFERINRAGTELNTYQLLTAWSWSEEFDFQDKFDEIFNDVEFGFTDKTEYQDLQLKCCSGVILGEATPASIMSLTGEQIRNNFDKIKNGVYSAVDFLKKELKVYSIETMPYSAMFVPLVKFFATEKKSGHTYNDHQRKEIIKWFWIASFSKRYSSSLDTKHKQDLKEFRELKNNPNYRIEYIHQKNYSIPRTFFTDNRFDMRNVNTKTFILMLVQKAPKSFISGSNVDLSTTLKLANRNEFHHIFPKKYLTNLNFDKDEINQLANFCFLSSADNQKIKAKAPSEYKNLITQNGSNLGNLQTVMEHALCPHDALDLNFDEFINKRVTILCEFAEELIK